MIPQLEHQVTENTVLDLPIVEITEGAQKHFIGLLSSQDDGTGIRVFVVNPGTPHAECGVSYCPPDAVEKDDLKIMSFGFLLGDGPAVMRGPMVTNYINQILHNTAWGELDYLFVDMPPGTGDIQLTITQSVQLSGAVIVTTPQTLSLIDVTRGILMFEKVDVPILGLIENMSFFLCDNCDKKHYIFGKNTSQSQILGGCSTVVEGLGAVRNKLSDSHGKGKGRAKPGPRHARLAVNLAGAMATFLVETYDK